MKIHTGHRLTGQWLQWQGGISDTDVQEALLCLPFVSTVHKIKMF